MSKYDFIADIGRNSPRPIAAFLVGREQKRARERQEQIDELNERNTESIILYRQAQIDAMNKPQEPKLDPDVVEFMQVTRTPYDDPDFDSKFVDYKQSLKGPAPSTTINLPQAERAGNKILLEGVAKNYVEQNQEALKTRESDATLNRMKLALSRGAQTGTGEKLILEGRKLLETLGVADLPESANEQEIFAALGNQLALIARNPESGLGLPGSTSNKDLDFLLEIVPNLGKTERANALVIEATLRTNKMRRDVAAYRRQLVTSHGGVYLGLEDDVAKFASDYELFTDAERIEMENMQIANKNIQERLNEINKAPQWALDALAQDPSLLPDFIEHYGYTPEGY